jgi:hypothetical protein
VEVFESDDDNDDGIIELDEEEGEEREERRGDDNDSVSDSLVFSCKSNSTAESVLELTDQMNQAGPYTSDIEIICGKCIWVCLVIVNQHSAYMVVAVANSLSLEQ